MSSTNFKSSYIPLHKTQLHPRMHSFSLISQPPPLNPTKSTITASSSSSSHKIKFLLLIIFFALLPFLLYLLSLSRSLHLPSSSSFGIVIDISLSRSQVTVFRSLNEVSGAPFSRQSSESKWVEPGLSGLSLSEPGLASRVLLKLVEFAKERVPMSEWKETKVQLMVTGYVVVGRDGFDAKDKVLEECRRVLRSSGLLFRDHQASVLRVKDEGLYAWLAANYALGYIGNKPLETAGVIVLGGPAMQVSFASTESPPSEVVRTIRLAGVPYSLYTQSLKQFGQDAIWKLLHEQNSQDLRSFSQSSERIFSPCMPRGYELTMHASDDKLVKSHAAGNFSTCKSEISTLLKGRQGKCAHPPCEMVSSIHLELERKPHPQQRFFFSSKFLGLVPKASVSELEAAGHQFCDVDWEELKRRHEDIDDVHLSRSCFSHAFMAVLLRETSGIPIDDKRVGFGGETGGAQVDWRLGAFISQTMKEPLEDEQEKVEDQMVGNELVTYFLLFAVLLVFVLLAAFFIMKLRKPQLKIIYDLEKGRYIVTRASSR